MARRLIQRNYRLVAFDARSEALDSIVTLGARATSSPKEVADRADTVMASLPSPAASRDVATGAAGVIEGSRVKRYVDLSTVGSQVAVQIHDLLPHGASSRSTARSAVASAALKQGRWP